MTTSAFAFSASLPAYMMRIVSATWARIDRSCVITIVVFTKSRSRNSSSISPTARWVETSRAEVISSAMSNDGLRRVEMIITTRCFIPPESSIGYRLRMSASSPTSLTRRSSSGSADL